MCVDLPGGADLELLKHYTLAEVPGKDELVAINPVLGTYAIMRPEKFAVQSVSRFEPLPAPGANKMRVPSQVVWGNNNGVIIAAGDTIWTGNREGYPELKKLDGIWPELTGIGLHNSHMLWVARGDVNLGLADLALTREK